MFEVGGSIQTSFVVMLVRGVWMVLRRGGISHCGRWPSAGEQGGVMSGVVKYLPFYLNNYKMGDGTTIRRERVAQQ